MFFAKRPKRPAAAKSQGKTLTQPMEQNAGTALSVFGPTSAKLTSSLELGGALSGRVASLEGSTQSRIPIVIKGTLQRPVAHPPRSKAQRRKHSKRLWVLGIAMMLITLIGSLLSFTPQGREITARFDPSLLKGNSTIVVSHSSNAAQVSALATTTWMYQNDGYDPFSHGVVTLSDGKSSLPWPYGQCTYWANYRYHQLAHFWVQWTGNADQWFQGAKEAGWDYGQTPPPAGTPSIIVLMPYVQGAGGLGHVAVVESQSGNVVHTSNMNWGYGGWTHTENVDFTIGSGVYFVWHKPVN